MPGPAVVEQAIIDEWFPEQLQELNELERRVRERLDLAFAPIVQQAVALVKGLLDDRPSSFDRAGRSVWRLDESDAVAETLLRECGPVSSLSDDDVMQLTQGERRLCQKLVRQAERGAFEAALHLAN